MTIRNSFPDVRPALNLDFANTKRLDPRITFTRSSTGTYVDEFGVIKTAASNEARFDHDGDGNSLGLLIEESRTNLLTYSEDFTNSAWKFSNEGTTTTGNQTNAPDGLLSADQIVENTATTQHRVYGWNAAWNVTNGNTYTFSIYVKANGRDEIQIYSSPGGFNRTFDLANPDSQMQELPNGWYRCWLTGTATSTSIFSVVIYMLDSGSNSYTGDGTSGVYLWGAQLEQGSFPTSYIPTSGSTATRSADVASMTGTNFSSWYNSSEGTVFYQGIMPYANVSGYPSIYRIGVSSQNQNEIDLLRNPSGKKLNINVHSGGSTVYAVAVDPLPDNYKVAVGYETDNFNAASSGTLTGLDTSGAAPVGADRFLIEHANTRHHIARLTYYDRRLTDAQLQALTL